MTEKKGLMFESVTDGAMKVVGLRFGSQEFSRATIIELAGSGGLVFNKALVAKANIDKIVSLEDLQKRYPYFSKLMLDAWTNDPDAQSYYLGNGRLIPQQHIMSDDQRAQIGRGNQLRNARIRESVG